MPLAPSPFAESPAWLTYTSDTVENYEIGIKGMLGGMRYDLSAFQIDWNDPQLNTATPTWGFFVVANGDSAESRGIELQLSGEMGDSMTWGFGWAYTDAQLTSDFTAPYDDQLSSSSTAHGCRARRRIR